jgi:hypothetical protein
MMRRVFRHRVEVQTWLLLLALALSLLLAALMLHQATQPKVVDNPSHWYITQEQPFVYANTPEDVPEYA